LPTSAEELVSVQRELAEASPSPGWPSGPFEVGGCFVCFEGSGPSRRGARWGGDGRGGDRRRALRAGPARAARGTAARGRRPGAAAAPRRPARQRDGPPIRAGPGSRSISAPSSTCPRSASRTGPSARRTRCA